MPTEGNRPSYKDEGLPVRYRQAISYYIKGYTKKAACEKAGFGPNASKDIFAKPEVKDEVNRRMKQVETKSNIDREWLIEKLKEVVEASPGELLSVDERGRASIDWSNMTPSLRRSLSHLSIDETQAAGKWKRKKTKVNIKVPDRIAAIKEIAILLGVREEKTKLQMDAESVNILTRRRDRLAESEE